MRTVAGAEPIENEINQSFLEGKGGKDEPSSVVTRLANGHTTQVRADTKHDKPLWPLRPVLVALRIAELFPVLRPRLVDLALRPVTNEDGLATPFDDDVLALGDVR